MTRYLLVPAENEQGSTREIILPEDLISNKSSDCIKNKKIEEDLLVKLKNVGITSNKNGLAIFKGKTLKKVKFNEVVTDMSKGTFKDCHEHFYLLLRDRGITF